MGRRGGGKRGKGVIERDRGEGEGNEKWRGRKMKGGRGTEGRERG